MVFEIQMINKYTVKNFEICDDGIYKHVKIVINTSNCYEHFSLISIKCTFNVDI